MPRKEVPPEYLQRYLPEGTASTVLDYLVRHRVHLTITRERKSILGDYRHRTAAAQHRISVNGTLNVYAFLITLLHELAHLLTFERFGNRVEAHGREWKGIYGILLEDFLQRHRLPADIEGELRHSLKNPGASSCAEEDLVRVLRRYDPAREGHLLVEELDPGTRFQTSDGRRFIRGEKLRKRFRCRELDSGKEYLFSGVYEVRLTG